MALDMRLKLKKEFIRYFIPHTFITKLSLVICFYLNTFFRVQIECTLTDTCISSDKMRE